ncbi:MAG: V-type ATP synthase subunit I [Treponema sp.]|nr:V-type ATP synthase subunit I [Treponema sp.]
MKKVNLVVQDSRKDEALTRLRDLGVMHIEMSKGPSEKLDEILERKARVEKAIALFKNNIKQKKAPQKEGPQMLGRRASDRMGNEEQEPYSADAVNTPSRPNLVDLLLGMAEELKGLEEQYALLTKERGRIAPWGEFDPADLEFMALNGVNVYLYELSPEMFKNIPDETRFVKVSEGRSSVQLLVLDEKIPDVQPLRIPEKPLSQLDEELREMKGKLDALDARIRSFENRRPVLEKMMVEVQRDFDFERAKTELESVEGLPSDLGISHLTGYVPTEELNRFKIVASKNSWAYIADDPGLEDPTPTELRNNPITKLISPLTGFLELLPGYHERDVSGWFLLFVTIFFGIILGDAAYGAIFFVIALIGIIKTAKNGVPLGLRMLMVFAIGNIAWGTVTASWFAIDHALLPQFLLDLSLPWLTTATGTPQSVVNENLQVFCFSLALLHLGIARLGGVFKKMRGRDLRFLADLGSIGMLVGMHSVILFLVVSSERFPIPQMAMYALAGGFALSFLFSYYEKNILQSILGSLKNIFPVVLGVTGIFSDIMSYVRLWAVGMAGFALAEAFNTMASPMLGSFLIFAGALVLIAGHGLNIILNTLSVLVHGVRLNILEFSGHAGLTWSGIPYKPFAEPVGK